MRRDLHVTHNRFPKAIPRGHLDKVSRWLQNDELDAFRMPKGLLLPTTWGLLSGLIDKRERTDSITNRRWRFFRSHVWRISCGSRWQVTRAR